MRHIQFNLPTFSSTQTYSGKKAWAGSARNPVKFRPVEKKKALKLLRAARRMDRLKRNDGKYGGAVGMAALKVYESLILDFMNYRTGRLDPSYETIADATGLSRATVARALKRLKSLGLIHWVRRCAAVVEDGVFTLVQESNAYAVLPVSLWKGFREAVRDVLPHEWGAVPVLPDALEQAIEDGRKDVVAMLRGFDHAASDPLARSLASLGRHFV